MIDEELKEEMAQSREIASKGDPLVFGPLIQLLNAAESEQDAVVAMLAITIADLDQLEKRHGELLNGEAP